MGRGCASAARFTFQESIDSSNVKTARTARTQGKGSVVTGSAEENLHVCFREPPFIRQFPRGGPGNETNLFLTAAEAEGPGVGSARARKRFEKNTGCEEAKRPGRGARELSPGRLSREHVTPHRPPTRSRGDAVRHPAPAKRLK